MSRKLILIAVSCTVLLSCSLFSQIPPGEEGNIEQVLSEDAEMNAAIQQAQATLPLFIQALLSPEPTQIHFSIKAKFPYGDDDSAEHMWISELTFSDNVFEGTLANEPVYISSLQIGDTVSVQISNVSDWFIVDGDKLLGGYTIHVLRNRMTPDEREQFDSEFGVRIPDEPALP